MSVCKAEAAAPPAGALVTRNLGLVYHLARRFFRIARARNIDPDDLVAEGALALCRAAADYRPGAGAKFSSFAGRVILHALVRLVNGRRYRWVPGQLPVNGDGRELDPPDPRAVPEAGVALDARAVLGRLGDRDRQVLRLRYLDGLTVAQVGRRLGVSPQRATQLLARALRNARRLAGQAPAGPGG